MEEEDKIIGKNKEAHCQLKQEVFQNIIEEVGQLIDHSSVEEQIII